MRKWGDVMALNKTQNMCFENVYYKVVYDNKVLYNKSIELFH